MVNVIKEIFNKVKEILIPLLEDDFDTSLVPKTEYLLRFSREHLYYWAKDRDIDDINSRMFYSLKFSNNNQIIEIERDGEYYSDSVDEALLKRILKKLPDRIYNYKDEESLFFFSVEINNQPHIKTIVYDTSEDISRWYYQKIDDIANSYQKPDWIHNN